MHISSSSPFGLFNCSVMNDTSPQSSCIGEKYYLNNRLPATTSQRNLRTSYRDTNSIHGNECNLQLDTLHSTGSERYDCKKASSSSTVTLPSSVYASNDLSAQWNTSPVAFTSPISTTISSILPGVSYTSSSADASAASSSGQASPKSATSTSTSTGTGSGDTSSASHATRASTASNIKIPALDKYNLRTKSIQNRIEVEKKRKTVKREKCPKPKAKPAPLSKYRRKKANTKERSRMQEMNDAFEKLRSVMPELPEENETSPAPQSIGKCKMCKNNRNSKCNHCKVTDAFQTSLSSCSTSRSNLTKITTLKLAVNYIATLMEILKKSESTPCNDETQSLDDQGQMASDRLQVNNLSKHMPECTSNRVDNSFNPCTSVQSNSYRYSSSTTDVAHCTQSHVKSNEMNELTPQVTSTLHHMQHTLSHHLTSPVAYNSSSPAPSSSNSSSWLSDWDPFSSPVGADGGLTPDVDSLVGDVCDTFDLILESDEFQ